MSDWNWLLVAGLMVGVFAGCSGGGELPVGPGPDTGPPLDTVPALPDTAQGINLIKLRDTAWRIRQGEVYAGGHSMLVMRRGEMVFEEYFNGATSFELHTLQSVSKSVTSALIGIALGNGDLTSTDEPVLDFFPQWREELAADPRRAAQRVQHLLTMQTGTDYHENGDDAPHWELNRLRTGWDRFWLNRDMVSDPGTVWQYDSGGVITLSSILKARTGLHADGYAERHLFGPLGITNYRWIANDEGHPHTGGGLHLTSRDMMKFGQLFLQNGVWEGEQVVPAEWVDLSTRRHYTFPQPAGVVRKTLGYGYLWWIWGPDPAGSGGQEIFAASGFGGQYIIVVPELEMVVVFTGWLDPAVSQFPIALFYNEILPAVISR